jgi:mRNA interferase MazF
MPTHIELDAHEHGLVKNSVVLLEQIRTIDKRRLRDKVGELSAPDIQKINKALLISLGFSVAK